MAYKNRIVPVAADKATASANTEVVLTFAARAGRAHVLYGLSASYSATPTGGRLRIQRGTTDVFDIDLPSTFVNIVFEKPIGGETNEALVVRLAAGGSAIVGKISTLHEVVSR